MREKKKLYAKVINNITSYILESGFDVITYECWDGTELYNINVKVLENTEFKKKAVLHKRIINGETGEKKNH